MCKQAHSNSSSNEIDPVERIVFLPSVVAAVRALLRRVIRWVAVSRSTSSCGVQCGVNALRRTTSFKWLQKTASLISMVATSAMAIQWVWGFREGVMERWWGRWAESGDRRGSKYTRRLRASSWSPYASTNGSRFVSGVPRHFRLSQLDWVLATSTITVTPGQACGLPLQLVRKGGVEFLTAQRPRDIRRVQC